MDEARGLTRHAYGRSIIDFGGSEEAARQFVLGRRLVYALRRLV